MIKTIKIIFITVSIFMFLSCKDNAITEVDLLTDGSTQTGILLAQGDAMFEFQNEKKEVLSSYKIWSSQDFSQYDPSEWRLYGSNTGHFWKLIDEQTNQDFYARFQENLYSLSEPVNYENYRLVISSNADSISLSEVAFFTRDLNDGWNEFPYPEVVLTFEEDTSRGSQLYSQMVQDADKYVKYHTKKVCQILHYSQDDPLLDVDTIRYTLRHYDGISSKGGSVPTISIQYSTMYCEKIGSESLYYLNDETRGVLFHELTHAYQYEPKNCGNYGDGGVFWAQIEGLADAVRTEAGLFDIAKWRKPGGNWMDGYKTTGFFLHWLKTKDEDAIRKFHASARDLPTWSFDGAMKYMFGQDSSIDGLWNEYQEFLKDEITKTNITN